MTYLPMKGGTLLVPSGSPSKPDGKHLFVILNAACSAGRHAMVSLSTIRDDQHHDASCILEIGEHEFVKSRSFIRYNLARIEATFALQNAVYASDYLVRAPMIPSVVDRMIAGALTSDFASGVLVKYLKALPTS